MNLLAPDLLAEAYVMVPATGEPAVYVSLHEHDPHTVETLVKQLINAALNIARTHGMQVSGSFST